MDSAARETHTARLPSANQSGVYYVAYGEDYLEEATRSAESLRRFEPKLSIGILADRAVSNPIFSVVIQVDEVKFEFERKIEALLRCPFKRAIYLDSDTYIAGTVSELFAVLTRYDLAGAHASWRQSPELVRGKVVNRPYPLAEVPAAFPEINTGVLAFTNCARIRGLFRIWLSIFRQQMSNSESRPVHDQPAFREALWRTSIPAYVLPPEYNYRADFPGYAGGSIHILHGKHPQISTLATVINAGKGARVFVPARNELFDSAELMSPEIE